MYQKVSQDVILNFEDQKGILNYGSIVLWVRQSIVKRPVSAFFLGNFVPQNFLKLLCKVILELKSQLF